VEKKFVTNSASQFPPLPNPYHHHCSNIGHALEPEIKIYKTMVSLIFGHRKGPQKTDTGFIFNMASLSTNIRDHMSHKSSKTSSKTIIHCKMEINLEVGSHDAVTGILPGLYFRWKSSFTKRVSNGYEQLYLNML